MKLPRLSNIGNFFPRAKPRLEPKDRRPFSVIQIEVTSRCGTGCVFCPHDALSESWIEGDLPIETYRDHIAPHLDRFELVYLQGWGEPMLHPDLWEMISLAQSKGCQTGFTTNGTWLLDEQNRKILDLGVNLISVSFAGTAAPVHESLRTGSEFARLCTNFEDLANLKRQRGSPQPWLELHFLMTRANLHEFPALVELAASLGADEIVATNLSYSPSRVLDRMHIFGEQPLAEDSEVLARAKETAARLKMPLRAYPLQTELNTLVCDADPLHTVYVNHRGAVTPCVYLGLTVRGTVPRYFRDEARPFDTISFGNVREGLVAALEGKRRSEFTGKFDRRKRSATPLAAFSYLSGQGDEHPLPPPPDPCQFCYKMMGI